MSKADDDPRHRILRVIEEHPGCHLRGLARIVPVSFGALRHHLEQLEQAGLIRTELDQRFRRYFPAEMDGALRNTCAAMRQRQLRRIMVHLLDHPNPTRTEISRNLGLPLPSVAMYVRRLRRLGLVKEVRPGHGINLEDRQRTQAALIRYRPSLLDALIDGALQVFEEAESTMPPERQGRP